MMWYPKINSIFKRSFGDYGKTMLFGQWAKPEIEYLANSPWEVTEKVDGTNIRIEFKGCVNIEGRTDRSNIPPGIMQWFFAHEDFLNEKLLEIFGEETQVTLYGEGYGAGIQKVGKLYREDNSVIFFDIRVKGLWLTRKNVEDLCAKLKLDIVPLMVPMTLNEAIEHCQAGFASLVPDKASYVLAEGLILKNPLGMLDRRGDRIITKIKFKDFPQE